VILGDYQSHAPIKAQMAVVGGFNEKIHKKGEDSEV
jgi:hypothetical protein